MLPVKILLAGRNGQLGWELERSLAGLGEVAAFDHASLDLADPDAIVARVREVRPEIIVNAAAYTAVDRAETEARAAYAVNACGPGILAEEARRIGALLVHYSTDYVFDGEKEGAYAEDDTPNPLSVYGQSKFEGEQAIRNSGCRHLILRTSWVYGARGKNFLLTILKLASERPELRVVDDQFGAPTWCHDIAQSTLELLAAAGQSACACEGLYHATASGQTTWCGFARAILDEVSSPARLVPIPTEAYPLPARRPRNSVLDCRRLAERFNVRLPDWRASLHRCMASCVDATRSGVSTP